MLFHLQNCLNCGELCLFLFFFVESGKEQYVCCMNDIIWFLFLQFLFPYLLQQIFGKRVSQDITVLTMSCSPCSSAWSNLRIFKETGFKNKKNWKWTFEIHRESRCQGFTWHESHFVRKPSVSWFAKAWVWRLPCCSTLPAFFTFKESQRDKSSQMLAANRVK